jgi:hypothetical protein
MGAAAHIARRTYRRDRHGLKPELVAADPDKLATWAAPRLPSVSPPQPLDPIEELMGREGIEILPEDRKPSG